jgi:hypothetical protein
MMSLMLDVPLRILLKDSFSPSFISATHGIPSVDTEMQSGSAVLKTAAFSLVSDRMSQRMGLF